MVPSFSIDKLSPQFIDEAKALIHQYLVWLGIDLSFQNIDDELADFPGKYSEPDGIFLVAKHGDRVVGCVGLRRIGLQICEMKRLFVLDSHKGQGLGAALVKEVIRRARDLGYLKMRLDTLGTMKAVRNLYRQHGFVEIPQYTVNPIPGAVFMEKNLMEEPTQRFWGIFFELYEGLPRQWPGNRACAVQALGLCRTLPATPAVLDLGCGVGGQTLYLTELLQGASITAMDCHSPSIERLHATVVERGLSKRILPVVGDMANPDFPSASFDLIWSEGALYNIGIEKALRLYQRYLCSGGYIAFTEAVWRKENPPAAVRAGFDFDYPGMGRVPDVIEAIARTGFSLVDHFTVPDEAWWDDFYTPMEKRIAELRLHYAADPEALGVLDQLAQEPVLHRQFSDYYAYEFFVVQS